MNWLGGISFESNLLPDRIFKAYSPGEEMQDISVKRQYQSTMVAAQGQHRLFGNLFWRKGQQYCAVFRSKACVIGQ